MTQRSRRLGSVFIWGAIILTPVLGIVSFAVDFGRVQLAKTELRRAADTAARYATRGLGDSTFSAKAIASAAENKVDGTAQVLLASDIQSGNWSSGVFTANATPLNAVRVTAYRSASRSTGIALVFARILGKATCDISATAVAYRQSNVTNGFVGLNSLSLANATIDSFDSTAGDYSASNKGSSAKIGSNGTISMASATVKGDVYYKATAPTGGTVTGNKMALAQDLTYPDPVSPSNATNLGAVNVSNTTYTMPSGNYSMSSMNVQGTTNVTISASNGPVYLYVNGPATLGGTMSLNVTGNRPDNFQIIQLSTSAINLDCTGIFRGSIYAPNSTVNINAALDFRGAIVAKNINLSNGATLHQDQSVTNGPPVISIVK